MNDRIIESNPFQCKPVVPVIIQFIGTQAANVRKSACYRTEGSVFVGFMFLPAPTRAIHEITPNRTNESIFASCHFVDRSP